MQRPYRILGNFHIIKGSRENISRSKIFALWAFHENNTWRKRGGYGRDWCICGCHVYHEIWEAATGAVTLDGRRTYQFWPEQSRLYCLNGPRFPLNAVRMASSTSQFAAAIAQDGIEDDNEPLGSGRLLQCFVVEKNSCVKFSRLLTTAKNF